MTTSIRRAANWSCLIVLAWIIGCSSSNDSTSKPKADANIAKSDAAEPGSEKESDAAKPFKLGDLIAPFTPPPLDEIDKTAEWVDQPGSQRHGDHAQEASCGRTAASFSE